MKKIQNAFKGDRVVWVVFFFLCIISLIEVYSAASTLTYSSGSFWSPLIKQVVFLGVGTLIVVGIHNVPCRYFKLIPILLLVPTYALLLFTSLYGAMVNGASRAIPIFGFQFQPLELGKGVTVVTTALILASLQNEEGADRRAFKWVLITAGIMCALIFPENLSTSVLLFGVVLIMMFIGRVSLIQLGKLLGVLMLFAASAVMLVKCLPDDKESAVYDLPGLHRLSTWVNRVETHGEMSKEVAPEDFDIDKDAQIAHAHIAIATSNVVGKMPGNSVERDFLSQAFSDFIFAIIIEEMGIWGAAIVVFLYIVLLFRAGRIASRCEHNFPAFLIMGLALLLVVQAVMNMLVAVGIMPVTGQPLPLISRGGTSTLMSCVYIGMILSVSRYARRREESANRVTPAEEPDVDPNYYNTANLI